MYNHFGFIVSPFKTRCKCFFSFVRKKCFVDAGIKRAWLAVDYAPAVLWITGLEALWITHLRCCGLREWDSLWISQHSVLGRIYPSFAQ